MKRATAKNVESAIIGMWRMGAPDEQISDVMAMFEQDVYLVINRYVSKMELDPLFRRNKALKTKSW